MYCQYCGKEVTEGEEFCIYCGKNLKKMPVTKKMYGHELTRLKAPKETKNPGVAAAIGFFMGWILLGPVGYIYLGQWNWFWITFVIEILAYSLTFFIGAYILLPIIFALHQYQMAKELNELVISEREKLSETVESGEREESPEEQ